MCTSNMICSSTVASCLSSLGLWLVSGLPLRRFLIAFNLIDISYNQFSVNLQPSIIPALADILS